MCEAGGEEEQKVQAIRDALRELQDLHSRGVMLLAAHRAGEAKVCDFAAALSRDEGERTRYMAPQTMYCEGESSTINDDMYAFGMWVCTMFMPSGIPEDLTAEDSECYINKHQVQWYWWLRYAAARDREAELHADLKNSLCKLVSPRWFPAISKLVVGCLRFSRESRFTPDEAAAILLPYSEADTINVSYDRLSTAQLVPLPCEYTCPVCMEDLYPAMAYQCLHKVCATCAPSCADCPKCRAPSPPPRHDHDFSNLVEHQRNVAGFVCDTCFTSMSQEERGSHTCADALADRLFAVAASAGVSRADLWVDAQTVIRAKQTRQGEMDRLEMDGMLTGLFLARSAEAAAAARDAAAADAAIKAELRAATEDARQEAAALALEFQGQQVAFVHDAHKQNCS